MGKLINPVIKWSGSKRPLAPYLKTLFPESYERYIEPFVGGGSMLPYRGEKSVASDIMPELISLWKMIQNDPDGISETYSQMWTILQDDNNYYYQVRDRFNENKDPIDFLFLTRTCYNGLIRFNQDGNFNTSHHFGRPGIHPDKMSKIIHEWNKIHLVDVEFSCHDYREILTGLSNNDFVFLDPPYAGTKAQYKSDSATFSFSDFEDFLTDMNATGTRWLLTLGSRDQYVLPESLYEFSELSPKFSSSFSRLKLDETKIGDMIYANYIPQREYAES